MLTEMRSLDELLRLARELSAVERRRLLVELEKLEDEALTPEENARAWAAWIAGGPQGPIDGDESWP
jgi:hypothetical protein